METAVIFIIGMFVGWLFYPQSMLLGSMLRKSLNTRGCSGSCQQGRKPCDCGRA